MAWAAAIAGILGAGGQIASGYLGSKGGERPGQLISPSYNPYLDPALRSFQFDALNQIGLGNPGNLASPFDELVNKVNSTAVDTKTKRRALKYLLNLQRSATGQEMDVRATIGPDGKPIGHEYGLSRNPEKENTYGKGRFNQVAQLLGLTDQDVMDIIEQDKLFSEQQKRLSEQLGVMNENTILSRAKAAATASGMLGEAANYASGADPNTFQSQILDRINRDIADQETKTLLQAQYGGYNPGEALMGIQRMKTDSNMTALSQAIAAANALTAGLAPGLNAAQSAAGMGSNAANNSLGIAAQQATAANQLNNGSSINRADSWANGLAGGVNQLGNSALTYYLLNGNRNAPAYSGNSSSSSSTSNINNPWGSAVSDSLNW